MTCIARISSIFAAAAIFVGCSDPIGCYSNEYEDGGYCVPLPVDSGIGHSTTGEADTNLKDGGAADGARSSGSGRTGSSVDTGGDLERDAGLDTASSSEPDGAAPAGDGAVPPDDAAPASSAVVGPLPRDDAGAVAGPSCPSGAADGCCPAGGNNVADPDCPSACGNAIPEKGELCDGNCPASCSDSDPCTDDKQIGNASSCDLTCSHSKLGASGTTADGCCPLGATTLTDADCRAVCGNGVKEPGETCDGACPTTCADSDPCTDDKLVGSSATCDVVCSHPKKVPSGQTKDSCCPSGANNATDVDCRSVCGNGVVEAGEECDGPDTWHCSKPQCQKRKIYVPCDPGVADPCEARRLGPNGEPEVTCDQRVCAPVTANYNLAPCPIPDGNYRVGIYFGLFCAISCNVAADCPPQLPKCMANPFTGADTREVHNYCTVAD